MAYSEDKDPFAHLDPAEVLAEEGGIKRLFDTAKEHYGLLTVDEAEEFANQKLQQRDKESAEFQRLANKYPDITNQDTPFAQETAKRYYALKDEYPHLDAQTLTRMAAAETTVEMSAAAARSKSAGSEEISDADIRKFKKTAGDLPDDVIRQVIKDTAKQHRARSRN
jgi:hypothetical protein